MSANSSKATYFDDGLPDRLATIAQIRSTIATIKNMTVNAALNASPAPLEYFGISYVLFGYAEALIFLIWSFICLTFVCLFV